MTNKKYVQMKSGKLNIRFNFWTLYFAFIIAMPYDVFKVTSILILEPPISVTSYRISVFYFSVLFLPFIVYAILSIRGKSKYVTIHPLRFILILILKDVFVCLSGIVSGVRIYWFATYGNYIIASLYFMAVTIIYKNKINDFLQIYSIVNVASMIFSFITGIGLSTILATRLHMSALQQGETAVITSILCLYFGFCVVDKFKLFIILAGLILVIATGNRKDIFYILLCVIIYYIRNRKKKANNKKINRQYMFLIIFAVFTLILIGFRYGKTILDKIAIDRYVDLLFGIEQQGFSGYILGDSSYQGRLASIEAGLNVIKSSPVLGVLFSLTSCQRVMQQFGYPTFPHSTVIYIYSVMGVFSTFPIVLFFRNGIKLIKLNHPLQYVYIYIMIRDTISGGANESIKYLLLMMIMLNIGNLILKNNGTRSS